MISEFSKFRWRKENKLSDTKPGQNSKNHKKDDRSSSVFYSLSTLFPSLGMCLSHDFDLPMSIATEKQNTPIDESYEAKIIASPDFCYALACQNSMDVLLELPHTLRR